MTMNMQRGALQPWHDNDDDDDVDVEQDISTNLNLIMNFCIVAGFFFVFDSVGRSVGSRLVGACGSYAGRCHRKMIITDWSLMPFYVEMAIFSSFICSFVAFANKNLRTKELFYG